ncbi:cyclic-di-AMP receptor [Caloranaerobacter ferrireducens]|uniref:cyclic-di-AMP receptor n=1 Tax=Caloranaerobacter ferrireducens TaxID=1323370 RepID=UPI00084D0185|nr:cyclic-di-AMP receptor [Caloranaerobacter ferrireducens]
MKLIIAIVQDEDAPNLIDVLMKNNYGVTKLASTGGFLKSGNTTLLIGVEKEKVDEVIKIIEELCQSRKQVTTSPSLTTLSPGVYVPYPVEVQVGGATIFVVDVDCFEKV